MAKNESKVAGGLARAMALTPERKRAIAVKAAATRWGKMPRATHKGNFKDEFGFDVDCYVLDDEAKTAVISQRGMGSALGLSERGNAFIRFANSRSMSNYIGAQVRSKIDNPIIFQAVSSGAQQQQSPLIHGYEVTLLSDLYNAILAADADRKLSPNQAHLARQARVLLNASSKAGFTGLVYALAGFDATREQIIAAFKTFVRDEAREYEKEFPDQLYDEWYRLYNLPRPERNKPWKFKHLTVQHVYAPLAQSNGKVLQLIQAQRAHADDRRKKLHQFLSEVGVKALRTHLGQLLGIAQISDDKAQYEAHWTKIFGNQPMLPGLD
jgi:P63C domain